MLPVNAYPLTRRFALLSTRFDLSQLQNSIDSLRRQKAEAEEHSINLASDLQNVKRAAVSGEDKARREAREQLTVLQQSIEKLENENLRLEDSKKRVAVEHASTISRVTRECEAARSDCQRIAREKEALAARSAGLADKQETLKSSASELEEDKTRIERQFKEVKAKNRSMEKVILSLFYCRRHEGYIPLTRRFDPSALRRNSPTSKS